MIVVVTTSFHNALNKDSFKEGAKDLCTSYLTNLAVSYFKRVVMVAFCPPSNDWNCGINFLIKFTRT